MKRHSVVIIFSAMLPVPVLGWRRDRGWIHPEWMFYPLDSKPIDLEWLTVQSQEPGMLTPQEPGHDQRRPGLRAPAGARARGDHHALSMSYLADTCLWRPCCEYATCLSTYMPHPGRTSQAHWRAEAQRQGALCGENMLKFPGVM